MTWQNIRLSGKFAIGFGLVLILLSLVAGWSILGVGNIVDDAKEVITGNALRAEMIQREMDHLVCVNYRHASRSCEDQYFIRRYPERRNRYG